MLKEFRFDSAFSIQHSALQGPARSPPRVGADRDAPAARAPEGAKARGKSELRRAVRRVTPGQGNLKDSGTENIPPAVAPKARGE